MPSGEALLERAVVMCFAVNALALTVLLVRFRKNLLHLFRVLMN